MKTLCLLLINVSFVFLCQVLSSQEAPPLRKTIKTLIQELGSVDYKKRKLAKNELELRIFEDLDQVKKAINGDDLEVAMSASELLSGLGAYKNEKFKGIPLFKVKNKITVDDYRKRRLAFLTKFYQQEYSFSPLKKKENQAPLQGLIHEMMIYFGSRNPADIKKVKGYIKILDKNNCSNIIFYYLAGSFYYNGGNPERRRSKSYFEKTIKMAASYKGSKFFATLTNYKMFTLYPTKNQSEKKRIFKRNYIKGALECSKTVNPSDSFEVRRYLEYAPYNKEDTIGRKDQMDFFKQLSEMHPKDSLLTLLAKGKYHHTKGWKARGHGFSNTVSKGGFKTFKSEIALSASFMQKAYKLFPDSPIAPAAMIEISKIDKKLGRPRDWFDKTIAIELELDNSKAFVSFFWTLVPRWGGSHQDIFSFVDEILIFGIDKVDLGRTALHGLRLIAEEKYNWSVWIKNPKVFSRFEYIFAHLLKKYPNNIDYKIRWSVCLYGKGRIFEHMAYTEKIGWNAYNQSSYRNIINGREYHHDSTLYNSLHNTSFYKVYLKYRQKGYLDFSGELAKEYKMLSDSQRQTFLFNFPKSGLSSSKYSIKPLLEELLKFGFREALCYILEQGVRRDSLHNEDLTWFQNNFSKNEYAMIYFVGTIPVASASASKQKLDIVDKAYQKILGPNYAHHYLYKKGMLRAYMRIGSYHMKHHLLRKKLDSLLADITDYGDITDFAYTNFIYCRDSFYGFRLLWRLNVKVFEPINLNFIRKKELLNSLVAKDYQDNNKLLAFWQKNANPGLMGSIAAKLTGSNTAINQRLLYLTNFFSYYSGEALYRMKGSMRKFCFAYASDLSYPSFSIALFEKGFKGRQEPVLRLNIAAAHAVAKHWKKAKKFLKMGLKTEKLRGPYPFNNNYYKTQGEVLAAAKSYILAIKGVPEDLRDYIKVAGINKYPNTRTYLNYHAARRRC